MRLWRSVEIPSSLADDSAGRHLKFEDFAEHPPHGGFHGHFRTEQGEGSRGPLQRFEATRPGGVKPQGDGAHDRQGGRGDLGVGSDLLRIPQRQGHED